MLDSLKVYLENEGICSIFIDFMPAVENQLEAVALFEWENSVPEINDGSGVHRIQVQVRHGSYDEAKAECKRIFTILDSGDDERLIRLSEELFCIGRPTRGPLLLERGEGYCTFYCEIALWANTN